MRTQHWFSVFSLALCLARAVAAHDIRCEQTADEQVIRHVDRYPDVIRWQLSLVNQLADTESIALRLDTPQLSRLGFQWVAPVPITIPANGLTTQSFERKVEGPEACQGLSAKATGDAASTLDSVATVYWETGAAHCQSRIVCHRGGRCVRTPAFGFANGFGLLTGGTLSASSGYSMIGNAGVFPAANLAHFPVEGLQGTLHVGDADARIALNDLQVTYSDVMHRPCDVNLTGQDLAGKALTPGVYCFTGDANLTGVLTLDGAHSPDQGWVFQSTSNLNFGPGARVEFKNGGPSCRVYWQSLGGAAVANGAQVRGSLLVSGPLQVGNDALVEGGLFSLHGPVSLGTASVFRTYCGAVTCSLEGGMP